MDLFDSKGRPKAAWKATLSEESARKGHGGFLYLDEVHLLPTHRGKALALAFVKGLLKELQRAGMSSLVVLEPFGAPARGVEMNTGSLSDEDAVLASAANIKLSRHFSRMGFEQVASEGFLTKYWFLCLRDKPHGFKTKGAAPLVAVAVPPKQAPPKVLLGKDRVVRHLQLEHERPSARIGSRLVALQGRSQQRM